MKCPKCGHTWKDEGRAKGGRASRRKAGPRCPVHGCFLRADGTCRRCEREGDNASLEARASKTNNGRSSNE